jgi:NAD(P)-dependent dehydrogenase (short-subunit alcohol dehydrogenase family)
LSSVGTIVARPTAGLYQRTKCALETMADALAAEMVSFGIKVTIIEPAAFHTESIRESSIKNSARYSGDPKATSALFHRADI